MKVVIAGGTGFIGRCLTGELVQRGHDVCVLTRSQERREGRVSYVHWDGRTAGAWVRELDGATAVVNLAGSLILTRWTDSARRTILASRLEPIAALVDAMRVAGRPPEVFISASAVGYYGNTGSEPIAESHAPGEDFAAQVCVQWEAAAQQATGVGVRVATPRIGLVLDPDGGALKPMLLAFRLFAGGPIGSGRQYFPWVHMHDLVRAIIAPIDHAGITGAYNVAAPEAVTMRQFADCLGEVLQRPSWLPVPSFAVRLALGEAAVMLLGGQHVLPSVLLDHGFQFTFPALREALRDLLRNRA